MCLRLRSGTGYSEGAYIETGLAIDSAPFDSAQVSATDPLEILINQQSPKMFIN